MIVVYIVLFHTRPQYMGIMGSVFGVASAVGPLLGGAFTDGPGWRWCLYINLSCGAVVFVLLAVFLPVPPEMLKRESTTWREKFTRMDPIGTLFFLTCVICLLLASQWGGETYNWSNARIVVLLVLAALLFIAFVAVQRWKGDNATSQDGSSSTEASSLGPGSPSATVLRCRLWSISFPSGSKPSRTPQQSSQAS